VAVGHDLPLDDAFEALKEWNARCSPPWSERDLRTKIRNANVYATGRRGEKLRDFPNTETGDAEFFASAGADVVRYDHRRKRWLIIDRPTGIWLRDDVSLLTEMMKGVSRERQRRAQDISDTEKKKKAFNWALGGESRSRITNALALAQSVRPIADRGDGWDLDPWLLGCPNGVVDLRTGELRLALPDERVTMRTRMAFDADAACPLFERTVRDIFVDDELVAYMQRALGYSLTADCREECFFLCWGNGSNGKGVLMKTVGWILGDYADDLPFSALELSDRSSIPNDIAKLVDKRFVTASETNAVLLNESRIKALTGRDPITARFLHQEFFTFEPVAKFWLAANEKPQVRDTSDGFWRRVHTIPFTQSFVDRADLTLKDRLREEGPGILAWMVRGCLAWQRDGLQPPAAVVEATKEYRAETHQVGRFIRERCTEQLTASVPAGDLLKAYQGWCFGQGEQPQFNRTTFDVEMKKRFVVTTKGNRVHYGGVGLLTEGGGHDDRF
jgi:putative DNA primase/helicase